MVRTLSLAAAIVALVAAAWLLGGTGRVPSSGTPRTSHASIRTTAPDPTFADLAASSSRLQAQLKARPPLGSPRRDPFTFYEPPPSRPVARPQSAVLAAALQAPRPDMQLVGIATDGKNGEVARVAVISAGNQVFLAKEGDHVLVRYVVVRVTEDAVQLRDGEGTFTLAMK